jgi:hypothetical protein
MNHRIFRVNPNISIVKFKSVKMRNRILSFLVLFCALAITVNAQNLTKATQTGQQESVELKSGKVDLNTNAVKSLLPLRSSASKVTFVSESFDTEIPATWTVNNTGTGDYPGWLWADVWSGNSIPMQGHAVIDSDENGSGNTTAGELITPAFDASGVAALNLEFDAVYNDITAGGGDQFTVDVWDGAAWVNVATWDEDHGMDGTAEHVIIPLIDYANADCQVRFVYADGGWDWYAAVDNVVIIEPEAHDLGAVAITPDIVLSGTTVQPMVSVHNYGANEETTFDIRLYDGVAYDETVTFDTTIAPNGDLTLEMPDWTPADGDYTLTAVVTVASDGDTSNDTVMMDATVGTIIFMGAFDSISTCEGTFFDSGGPDGDFQDNEDYTMTVWPGTPGNQVEVTFTEFDCAGSGFDYMIIYNGTDATAPVLVSSMEVGDVAMLSTFSAENPDGAITIYFHSSSVTPNPGWVGSFSCYAPPTHDLGVVAMMPEFVLTGTTVQPKVILKNLGITEEGTYTVNLTDGVAYDETLTDPVSITTFDTTLLVFPDWTPADGVYTLTAAVTLTDDENTDNDTMYLEVTVSDIAQYAFAGNATAGTYNEFNMLDGSQTSIGAIATDIFPMADEYAKPNRIYRVKSDASVHVVDSLTGAETALGMITGMTGTPTGLAYDWDNDMMYVVILDASNIPHFGTLDLATLEATEISTGTPMIIGMDFADDGFIYGPALGDSLYKIDPNTGVFETVGYIGMDINYGQDVTFDPASGKLYSIAYDGEAHYGTYNLSTGAFTELVNLGADQYAVFTVYDKPMEYTATFTVDDGTNPIEGATVWFYGNTFTTDVNGEATVMAAAGTYDFAVTNGFCDTVMSTFTVVDADVAVPVSMTCPDEFVVTFTVTEDWTPNDPVEGAMIHVTFGDLEFSGMTDAAGQYMFSFPANTGYAYEVSMAGYVSMSGTFDVVDADVPVNVAMSEDMVPVSGLSVTNIDEFAGTADFAWFAAESIELYQHDGAIPAEPNAYYQAYNMGYGVVYDLTTYPDAVVEKIDFHHLLWGLPASTFEYNVHIIDWTTYTTLDVVGPISTTVNDDWELDVLLGDVNAGGTTQLGIFIEPLSNAADDAYPDITSDNTPANSSDGNSIRITDLSNISGSAEPSEVGDFFIDLWIKTSHGSKSVKVNKLNLNEPTAARTRVETTTSSNVSNEFTQNASGSKEMQSFDVYLNDMVNAIATDMVDSSYQLTGLTPGTHTAGVVANYESGSSDMSTIEFVVPELTYALTFNVTDMETSAAVSGASVEITDGTDTWTEVTDGSGAAIFTVENGTYDYTVTKADYLDATGQVTVTDGAETVDVSIEPVGINDAVIANFNIYPNPSKGVFNVKSDSNGTITITNAIGNVIMVKEINGESTIDMSNNAAGIYFIRLNSDNKVATKRIIIE